MHRTFLQKYAPAAVVALVWPFVFKGIVYVATQLWEDWLVQAVHWMYGLYFLEYVATAITWYAHASLATYAMAVFAVALLVWIVSAIDTAMVARRRYAVTSAPPSAPNVESADHANSFEGMRDRLAKEHKDALEIQKLKVEGELAEERLRLLRAGQSKITPDTGRAKPDRTTSRRLWPEHIEPMVRTLRAGLQALSVTKQPRMMIIAIGMERETLDYRNDFVKVFEAAGFDVQTREWGAATREYESLIDGVTLLQLSNDATNVIRPIVMQALLSGGVVPREEPYPVVKSQRQPNVALVLSVLVNPPEATLVIGQRRFA